MSYYEYTQQVARDCQKAEGDERRAAAALKNRKAQVRKVLQPEYTDVAEWTSTQIKVYGLTSEILIESNARIAKLDALVAATV